MSATVLVRRLALLEQFCNTVVRVERLMNKLLEMIRARRASHCAARAWADAVNDAQRRPVAVFDVGGTRFGVQSFLCDGGNLLHTLSTLTTTDDPIFIDRDPAWFPLVLHALRDHAISLLYAIPATAACGAVLREARYYCVDKLVRAASLPVHLATIVGTVPQHKGALCVMSYSSTGSHIGRRVLHPNARIGRLVGFHGTGGLSFVRTRRRIIWQVSASGVPEYRFKMPQVSPSSLQPHSSTMVAYNPQCRTLVLLGWPATSEAGVSTDTWAIQYSVSASKWEHQWKPLPSAVESPRRGAAVCFAYDQILVVCTTAVNALAMPSGVRWVSEPPMPGSGVCNATIIAWCGEFIVIGGEDGHGVRVHSVAAYNPATKCWRQLPSMQQPRSRCIAYSVTPVLVVVGGDGCGTAECFDGSRWASMPALDGCINPFGLVG
jgi:hypothetical protein